MMQCFGGKDRTLSQKDEDWSSSTCSPGFLFITLNIWRCIKMRKHSAQLVQKRSKAIHMVVKYAKQSSSHLTCACGGCRSGGSDPVVSMWMRWMGGPAMLPVMVMLGETTMVLPINTSFVSFSSCSTRITSSFSEKRPHPYGISWGSIQCFT